MATGDVRWFRRALLDLGEKLHDLSSDTFRLGIVTTATAPTVDTADPRWGAGGTTNFSTNQVATGGTSYTGPQLLGSVTWTQVSNIPTFRAANVSLAQDASGFTNGAYGIIYNDTDAGKRALGWVEISAAGSASLVSGPIVIDWNGANGDIFTITQAA